MSLVLVVGLMPGLSAWGEIEAQGDAGQAEETSLLADGGVDIIEKDGAETPDDDGGVWTKEENASRQMSAGDGAERAASSATKVEGASVDAEDEEALVDGLDAETVGAGADEESVDIVTSEGDVLIGASAEQPLQAMATGTTYYVDFYVGDGVTSANNSKVYVNYNQLEGKLILPGDRIQVTQHARTKSGGGLSGGVAIKVGSKQVAISNTNTEMTKTVTWTVSGYEALQFGSISNNPRIVTLNTTTLPTYVLAFNSNGGAVGSSTYSAKHGTLVNLATARGELPSRPGYELSGWNTRPDGSGTHYSLGGSLTLTSEMTLYAEWTRTANLVAGPVGTASPGSSVTYHYDADGTAYYGGGTDTSVDVSLAPNASAGWAVLGWTKDPSSTTADYDPSFTITDTDLSSTSETFYAIGKRNLSLSYDANGADSGTAPAAQGGGEQTYNASGAAPLSTGTFAVAGAGSLALAGRVFAGWNTEADGTGDMYQAGDTITVNEPTTLYAQWAYPVVYDVNGGNASTLPGNQLKLPGIELELHAGKPSRDPDTEDITTTLKYNDGATADSEKKTRRSEAWEFMWWDTGADGDGDRSFEPGDTYDGDEALTLYAIWDVQDAVYGSTALPTPTWEGHDFLGWADVEDIDGKTEGDDYELYEGGSTYTPEADGTLYAQWKLRTYEVAYDANGGTGAPGAQEKAHGADLTLSDATPSRSDANKTVTLTLNYKGGAYKSGDDGNAFGEAAHDSAVANVKTEYTFQGWGASASAATASYQPNGAYPANANADATLYAVWKAETSGYGTYKLPEGKRESATSVVYEFKGWTTAEHSSKKWEDIPAGARWEKGADFGPVQADTTLYAVWDPPTYAVEYDGNGGGDTVAGVPALQNKEADDTSFTLASDTPSRSSAKASFTVTYDAAGGTVATTAANTTAANGVVYAFDKWTTAADGSGDSYGAGVAYTKNADLKLYAQWTKTGEVSPVTLPTPTRIGYEFDGWYTAAAGGDKVEGDGEGKYTPEGDIALYAHWDPYTYTVNYDANAGGATVTNMPDPLTFTKTQDAAAVLSASEPARADESGDVAITYDAHGGSTPAAGSSRYESKYGFLSWKSDAGNVYAPGSAFKENGASDNAAMTLKAQWAETTTYTAVRLPSTSRTGYIFKGWFTAETGGDEAGDAGDEYTPASKEAVTLHAQWEPVKYDVTYDGNTEDATLAGVPDAQEKAHDDGAFTLDSGVPTRGDTNDQGFTVTFDRRGGTGSPASVESKFGTKHRFTKWTTQADGSGDEYRPGDTYGGNAALELYAQWEDTNTGDEVTLPAAPTPPGSGFAFKGWSLSKDTAPDDATGALLAPGSKVRPTGAVTYYAIYDPPVYVVSYDANGGTDAPDDQVKAYNQSLNLADDAGKPARADVADSYEVLYDGNGGSAARASDAVDSTTEYAFLGWAEDANVGSDVDGLPTDAEWAAYDSAKKHDRGDAYTANADLDLFAQWKETVASDPASVALPAADRPGYEFLGWYDAPSGGNRIGGAGDAYEPSGAATLYAQWEPYEYPSGDEAFEYTVVFESPEGTQVATQAFTFGQSQALNAGTLTPPSGRVFAGWRLKGGASTFTEHQLVANLTNVDGGEVFLVAQWKDAPTDPSGDPVDPASYVTYRVQYWEQGADGVMYQRESEDVIVGDAGESVEVPAAALDAPLGFHVAWADDDGDALTVDSGTVEADGSTVLSVYWARNRFDVSFERGAGDAAGTMADQRLVWASGETLTPNAFARPGWRFAGWKVTERDGAQLSSQSEGGLSVQSILDALAGLFLGAQAAVDAPVADASDGSRLTPTDIADGGHVTLTAQWERGSSGGGSDDPAGPTGPTDPTDPDDPGDPKDPRDELADKIREAEDLVDPDLHPGRPASPDEEKRLRDEIDGAKRVLDDPDATPGRLREATDRLSGAIAAFAAATGGGPGGPGGGGSATTTTTTTTTTTASKRKGSPSTGDSALLACAAIAASTVTLAAALLAGHRRRRGNR